MLGQGKEEIESQADVILLRVGTLAGIVFVLVVGVEFDVLSYRKQAARVKVRGAPFLVLTFIKGLGSEIGDEVIGVDRKSPLDRQFIAITPSETAIFPVE